MVHVSIAVEQISGERKATRLLVAAVVLGLVFVEAVAVVPRAAVGFPGSEADPAEVGFACGVLTDHVVAAPVFLNRGLARRALFRVGWEKKGKDEI